VFGKKTDLAGEEADQVAPAHAVVFVAAVGILGHTAMCDVRWESLRSR